MVDILGNIVEFVVITVGLKIIVGHWLAEVILKYSKKWFERTERHNIIWLHYQARARHENHESANVLHCNDGDCPKLRQAIDTASALVR